MSYVVTFIHITPPIDMQSQMENNIRLAGSGKENSVIITENKTALIRYAFLFLGLWNISTLEHFVCNVSTLCYFMERLQLHAN